MWFWAAELTTWSLRMTLEEQSPPQENCQARISHSADQIRPGQRVPARWSTPGSTTRARWTIRTETQGTLWNWIKSVLCKVMLQPRVPPISEEATTSESALEPLRSRDREVSPCPTKILPMAERIDLRLRCRASSPATSGRLPDKYYKHGICKWKITKNRAPQIRSRSDTPMPKWRLMSL